MNHHDIMLGRRINHQEQHGSSLKFILGARTEFTKRIRPGGLADYCTSGIEDRETFCSACLGDWEASEAGKDVSDCRLSSDAFSSKGLSGLSPAGRYCTPTHIYLNSGIWHQKILQLAYVKTTGIDHGSKLTAWC